MCDNSTCSESDDQVSPDSTNVKAVVAKGYYGLGGALATLISAIWLGRRLDAPVVIDWIGGNYGIEHDNVFEKIFRWPPARMDLWEELKQESSLCVWPELWQATPFDSMRLDHPDFRQCKPSDFFRATSLPAFIDMLVVSRPDTHVDRQAYNADLTNIAAEFRLRPDLFRAVRKYVEKNQIEGSIGVHVRHGNGEASVIPPDISWFEHQIEKRSKEEGDLPIFLCTDSKAVTDYLYQKYGSRLVTTTKVYLPIGSGALHKGRATPEDRLQSLEEAVIDMWSLSYCRTIISGRSYFAGFAKRLARSRFGSISEAIYKGPQVYNKPHNHLPARSWPALHSYLDDHGILTEGVHYCQSGNDQWSLLYRYEELLRFRDIAELDSIELKKKLFHLRLY